MLVDPTLHARTSLKNYQNLARIFIVINSNPLGFPGSRNITIQLIAREGPMNVGGALSAASFVIREPESPSCFLMRDECPSIPDIPHKS
jgi:hypothetical protein